MSNRTELVASGNAVRDGKQGWFVGEFLAPSHGLIRQPSVEIKWARHIKGERRPKYGQWPNATTISILVDGSFVVRLKLPNGIHEVILDTPSDYVAFAAGIEHSWEALEDSLVITVRFPSYDRR